jgi:hypothetical protein
LSSISPGQLIDIAGQLLDTNGNLVYATGLTPVKLDATTGQVRIQPTTLWADLLSTGSGTATVNLDWVSHYPPTDTTTNPATPNINFAGTGTSSAVDATAANYVINTGSLAVPTSPAGAFFPGLLQIVGTANTFGQGPPYFNASSITDANQLPQTLVLEWGGASASSVNFPYDSISASGLVVNLQETHLAPGVAGAQHYLRTGPSEIDIDTLNPNALTIVPSTAAGTRFAIGDVTNGVRVFNNFSDFVTYVSVFNGNAQGSIAAIPEATYKLVATGQYDPGTGTFTATNIDISVE